MNFFVHIIIMASLTLIPALGYNMVFGKGKILHFGQEGIALIASYSLWALMIMKGFSYPAAIFASMAATVLIALLFAWLSLRLEPDGFGVLSIAVHLMTLAIVLNWQELTRGALGIPKIPRDPWPMDLMSFAAIVLMITLLWSMSIWFLDRSRFGRALAALSEHPWHAQALGIERSTIHIIAFFVAGMGSLIANILFPPYIFLLSPTDYMFPAMIFLVMIVVAGKPGSVVGTSIATFLLIALKEALRFVPLAPSILGPVRLILFGLILFGVVWWRRDVLFPQRRSI